MASTRTRPETRNQANGQKSTATENNSYSHSSNGFAHWLEVAPPSTSIREVVNAYHEFNSPHEAWPSGNHRLDDFGGDGQ